MASGWAHGEVSDSRRGAPGCMQDIEPHDQQLADNTDLMTGSEALRQ
jgi:hypothetical protein